MAQATVDRRVDLKIIVIDDDPTGSQTVHGCPLLLRWDREALAAGLADPSPLLFVLANTRALAPAAAAERVREICRALRPLLERAVAAGRIGGWLVVSRGDSTLRGHFPLEVEVIAAELGPFDATLLVPAFLEGGRTTVDGVHLLQGRPVHESPFASDRLFGYATSYLPDWVAQKSGGRIPAAAVDRIGLGELEAAADALEGRGGEGFRRLIEWLAGLRENRFVVVDGQHPHQLAAFGAAVRRLSHPAAGGGEARRCRFLIQGAASVLQALAPLPPQPLSPEDLAARRRRGTDGGPLPGLVLVGSHVPLADRQLEHLLDRTGGAGVELPVERVRLLLGAPGQERALAGLEQELGERLHALLAARRTAVLFTSRGEIVCRDAAERRVLGEVLAVVMARVAAGLAGGVGYLISKGGITSQTLLADGFRLGCVSLLGQILPGLSLVVPAAADRGAGLGSAVEGLPILTFPGNLGDDQTLARAWSLMEGP